MPYTQQKDRDPIFDPLEIIINNIKTKGDLNFTICELVGRLILKFGIGYSKMSELIDALPDAEAELRRRLLNPYEDVKIKENGDVPSFETILQIIHEGELGDQNGN